MNICKQNRMSKLKKFVLISILLSVVCIICVRESTVYYQQLNKISNIFTSIENVTVEIQSGFKSFQKCEFKMSEKIHNFYLIKSYKAASSTISNILYRYGLKNNLDFVEPQNENTNQIFPFSQRDTYSKLPLIPSCGNKYNISTLHSRFEGREKLEETMPKNTIIIGSVRNPITQMRSSFNYLRFGDILRENNIEFEDFIGNPLEYSRKYLDFPVDFGLLKYPKNLVFWNQQSQVFGLYDYKIPPGVGRKEILANTDYQEEIEKFLGRIENEVDFVFIAENFIESIAIFRETFHLDYSDVTHFKLNFAVQNYSKIELTQQQEDLIIEWSYIDWILYERMLAKFQKIKASLTYDLQREIKIIQQTNLKISDFCMDPNKYVEIKGEFCPVKLLNLSEQGKKNVCCRRVVEQEWMINSILKKYMKEKYRNC